MMITDDDDGLRRILTNYHSLAIVGIKRPGEGPAWDIPRRMRELGYSTIGVNPKYDAIEDVTVYPSLADLPAPCDIVVLFRRSEVIEEIAKEVLALDHKPSVVWMQLGIRNDRAAQLLAHAGIEVVQDRCIYVEHRRLCGG